MTGTHEFPDGFLFGSSTAAHQVEGGNTNNDWWAREHAEGSTAVEPSRDAIDQFNRYSDDFALLAELGQNAHLPGGPHEPAGRAPGHLGPG